MLVVLYASLLVALIAYARTGLLDVGAPWMAVPLGGVAVLCWLLHRYGGVGDSAVHAGNGAVAVATFFAASAGVDDTNAAWLPVSLAAGTAALAASCVMFVARRRLATSSS